MTDDERTLIDLQNEWMAALRRLDYGRLEEILAPEFTLTSARTDQLIDRAAWLGLLDTTRANSFEYSDFHINVFGDAAVVKSRLSQVATVGGKSWNATFMLTDVSDLAWRPLAGGGPAFEHATRQGVY